MNMNSDMDCEDCEDKRYIKKSTNTLQVGLKLCVVSVIEACLQTRLQLPKATARKNGKQMKQILQQIPQCSSSKGITIGLAWHFITEYYTPAKKSLSQNIETTSSMADHRKQMLHVFHHGLPEFGCEDMIGHRSDDQLCLFSSKFIIIFPVSTCIVTIYWDITSSSSQLAW